MKIFTGIAIATFLHLSAIAQVSLPYYSGFDNSNQQEGWTEYKTASLEFSHWNIASANAFSDPNCISHDYSPATGITLTDNWFVSPGFSIETGGTLDSIRYMFSGFSTPLEGDTIGVYLLNGSQNPELATSIQLLLDFRGEEYITDFQYRQKSDIALPPSPGLSYIGIRYRNTDCSSKWLTVNFDNIAVNGNPLGLTEISEGNIRVFPNPTSEFLTISADFDIESVQLFNSLGQLVYSKRSYITNKPIALNHLSKGLHVIVINSENKEYSHKILLE